MSNLSKKIFIVDDSRSVLDALARALSIHGYSVETSIANGAALGERIAKGDIGLVLLDIMLSGQDGRIIMHSLKRSPLTGGVPIVAMSANPLFRESSIESGADMFLEKPFSMKDLVAVAQRYIGPIDENQKNPRSV